LRGGNGDADHVDVVSVSVLIENAANDLGTLLIVLLQVVEDRLNFDEISLFLNDPSGEVSIRPGAKKDFREAD
jgi:hypothetical protein